ncbi:hypothetical protein GGI03_009122, partial [Coemansia sp. RSA 2337]
ETKPAARGQSDESGGHIGASKGDGSQRDNMTEYAADVSAQWYFSKEDMRNTPSVTGSDYSASSGKSLSPAEEYKQRLRGCTFIHNVVKKLD